MQALAKFMTVLLGIALAVTAAVYTLNATIWNAQYMQSKLASQSVADQVAAVLPDLAAKLTGNSEETKTAISSAVTPGYVRDQLANLVPQVVTYYKTGGQPPLIDLRDVQQRVEAEGLTLPPALKSYIENPQPVSTGGLDAPLVATSHWVSILTWAAPLASLVLAVLIFLLAGHGRWLSLAIGTISGSALTLVAALISYAPSPLVSSALNTSNLKLLSPVAKTITDTIAHDQVTMFLTWAKGYAILAGILLVIHIISRLFGGHHKRKGHKSTPVGTNGMPEFN